MEFRREQFQRQLGQLAGTANPRHAIEAGLYVPRPTPNERLVRQIELVPTAVRVITGPIGSGKSTELLVLAQALKQLPQLWSIVIDVSLVHDVASLREGSLIAAALLVSSEALGLSSDFTRGLEEFAYGERGPTGHPSDGGLTEVVGAGVLTSPRLRLSMPIERLLERIQRIFITEQKRTPVFIFDSLDRVRDTASFRTALEKDARMLVEKGFGVVLTAPIDTLWSDSGELRALTESWDILPYTDPANDSAARDFLVAILRRRADPEILPEPTWQPLVRASGGVIRDLVDLAKSAVVEAYFDGRPHVSMKDVEAAEIHLARALTLGIDGNAIAQLLEVQATRRVKLFDEPTLRMLKNRQILEHRDSSHHQYFEAHPVLRSILQEQVKAS